MTNVEEVCTWPGRKISVAPFRRMVHYVRHSKCEIKGVMTGQWTGYALTKAAV